MQENQAGERVREDGSDEQTKNIDCIQESKQTKISMQTNRIKNDRVASKNGNKDHAIKKEPSKKINKEINQVSNDLDKISLKHDERKKQSHINTDQIQSDKKMQKKQNIENENMTFKKNKNMIKNVKNGQNQIASEDMEIFQNNQHLLVDKKQKSNSKDTDNKGNEQSRKQEQIKKKTIKDQKKEKVDQESISAYEDDSSQIKMSDEQSLNQDNNQTGMFMNSLLLHNLNATHITQRRRDIKQNYKAKLPLDKLEQELDKKRQLMVDLLKKRIEIIQNFKLMHQRIGQKQSITNQIDYDMHLQYLQEYFDDQNQSQSKVQKVADDQFIEINVQKPQEETVQQTELLQAIEKKDSKVVDIFQNQTEFFRQNCHNIQGQTNQNGKCHWDFLLKEMAWMADDFDKEGKKKQADAKKIVRATKKHLGDKQITQERLIRELKVDLKRKSKHMSNIIQLYWKSCEKIVKHNYNVDYERKRQQMRTKKLENFVQKHLKLSVKVAETLNTKQFIQQSHYGNLEIQEEKNKNIADSKQQDETQNANQTDQNENKDTDIQNENQSLAEKTVEMAQNFLPTGHTLEKAQVSTKVPFLLRGSLREYQIIGMDWLVTLHNRKLNGILADEMGLGKTIQTISMLASLACDKGVWGPHLVIVPTTIIMNWEMEFKRWCPGFKILTYFGSQKERKVKRHGWSKDNSFHVCITSYKLVIQDHFAFRRKKWYYMILDEAQNIKNFKSQRWQTLLRFNTKRRLLLTGTPLQNDVMELWSLMHFLMPQIFSNQQDFKEWFSNPFSQSINQNKSLNLRVVQKLQSILRPFLLRRMKRDVEKQLPEKIEHIIQCNLSRRQRLLYDEYINQQQTQSVLADSDFFSIMGVLMQLRKVCNHPDLFEARTIESPFILSEQHRIKYSFPKFILKELDTINFNKDINLKNLNLILVQNEVKSKEICNRQVELIPARQLQEIIYENKQYYNICEDTSGVGSAPYFKNPLSQNLMTSRPFQDGLAIGPKIYSNFNGLNQPNSKELMKTIPSIMPFENSTFNIYKASQNIIPSYINSACIPFNQNFFSLPSFGPFIYNQPVSSNLTKNQKVIGHCENIDRNSLQHPGLSGPLQVFKSALQEEEQQRLLVLLAQKLSLFHSLDRQNRLQLLNGHPIFGYDCRESILIPLICSDIFDSKKHKYNNWQKQKFLRENNKTNFKELNQMAKAVLNPIAALQCCCWQQSDVKIEDWQEMSDDQIEEANKNNKLIKEITQFKIREIRRNKIRQQREMKLKQTKRVQRKKEIQHESIQEEFLIEIDYKSLQDDISICVQKNEIKDTQVQEICDNQKDVQMVDENNQSLNEIDINDQFENKFISFAGPKQTNIMKTVLKNYEEFITYEQYLKEQKEEGKLLEEYKEYEDIIDGKNLNFEQQQSAESLNFKKKQDDQNKLQANELLSISYKNSNTLSDLIISPMQRSSMIEEIIKNFKVIVPKCVAKPVDFQPSQIYTKHQKSKAFEQFLHQKLMLHKNVNQSLKYSNILFFPHRNLIQYDCGKLQRLAQLLKTLYNKGSKVIIFTQMTKMLDIFEQFLNLHGYIYVRLDGLVKTENRQKLVDRFNYNKKIFCFISSTRCGGVGINLTGADCVIFYDTDWNPAMDKQAQDRCHRIGQTKTVHIYRLICKNTIEENIFKKSLQKRELGGLIIEGNFNQEFFQKVSLRDIFSADKKGVGTSDISNLIQPRRINIFQDENIVFHGEGELQENEIHFVQNKDDEIILTGPIFQNDEQNGDPNQFEDQNNVDFETNSLDLEIQAKEMEKQRQAEQYRRKFEEALIRIEDQEDVVAMQNAKREQHDNYDEDLHEFVAIGDDGKPDPDYDPNNQSINQMSEQKLSEDQDNKNSFKKKSKDQEMLHEQQMMQQKLMKEQYAKQKINDGISLTQGDLKKHELIDWNENNKLNKVTKRCLEFVKDRFSFEEYLEERAQKDSKFVHLDEKYNDKEDDKNSINSVNKSDNQSEFSFSEEENIDVPATADHSHGQSIKKIAWDRQAAEQSYLLTKQEINLRLFQPISEEIQQNIEMQNDQQIYDDNSLEDEQDNKKQEEDKNDQLILNIQ